MAAGANVRSIDAIRDFRAALETYRAEGLDAMTALDIDIRRNVDWLEDQRRNWSRAVRECQDDLTHAKAALSQKQTVHPGDRRPDTTQEEKDVDTAKRRLAHAEDQLERCRRWEPQLQRAVDEFAGPARQMGDLFEADLPKAVGLLDRMLMALEQYLTENAAPRVAAAPPPAGPPPGSAPPPK